METSLVEQSREAIGAISSLTSRRQTGRWQRALMVTLLAPLLFLFSVPAHAQGPEAAYRQMVLSIQQLIENQQLDAAATQIAAATKRFPADGGLENLLGVVKVQQGDEAGARQAFSAAIRHNPRLGGAYLNLARLDMRAAATDPAVRAEALRLSQKAALLEPASDEAHYQAATLLAWDKAYRSSLDHLMKLSAQARRQIGALGLACADEAWLGHRAETTEAATTLAASSELTEQDAAVCLPALQSARRADLIENIYAAAAVRQPLSAPGLRILGLAQEAEGKLPTARATLESAFTADSTSTLVLVDLARVAEAASDHEGALGYLAHARAMQPTDASLPYEFGAICLKMGLYGEGRKAIAEAVKLAPDNPEYNYGMGMVASLGQDAAEALPFLNKYRTLRPSDPLGTLALGATYFRARDDDAAVKWLREAAANEKTSAEAHYYLGRIARQEGKVEEAAAELKRSLALRPEQADVLAELGQLAVTTKAFSEAASYLERAIQLDSDNYGANFGLLQLYARTGDARREQQSRRFDEIKEKKEEKDRAMMRILEIRPEGTQVQHE